MNTRYIEFVTYKEITVPYIAVKWWDKYRWRLVKILGGKNPNDTVKIIRIPINDKDFMDRIYHQKRELFDTFNLTPQKLLIGADDYEKLIQCPSIPRGFKFNASYNYNSGHHIEIHGLKVEVVPWMRGYIVMPDETRE